MVQNVDVNIPLVLCFWFEHMDEFVDYVVPIDFPIPCLSIYFGLQEFLIHVHVVDP